MVAGNLPGSGSPRMAEAMHADQSVASAEDDCSRLSGFFAKRYPDSQSQRHWKLQLSQYLTGCSGGSQREGTLEKDVVEVGRKRRSNGRQTGKGALRKAASMK